MLSLRRLLLVCCIVLVAVQASRGQDFKPPPGILPDEDTLKVIRAKTKSLEHTINQLRRVGLRDPGLADVEVYQQAAAKIVEHEEFFVKDSPQWTLDVLDRGMLRAKLLAGGDMPWPQSRGFAVVRGYRSRLDGSAQPYAVTLPKIYGKDPSIKWPVEVWLHGRDKTLTEVKFLKNHSSEKDVDLDVIRIDIYGRGNNAYRWAGEVDVFEVIDSFLTNERLAGREALVDMERFVLRGFSMGGAGTWHLGLHHPDRWCAINPGAGFTTTHGYIKGLDKLPAHQEACLKIYDAVDYAENAFNVPVFAYSGAKDPQKLAADLIENRLKKLGIPHTHMIAPDLEHKYPPEWQAKVKAAMKGAVNDGRPEYPGRVQFTTYTLRYPTCYWVEVLALDRHYEKSEVNAERVENGFNIKTTNIRTLHLTLPQGAFSNQEVTIDGQKLSVRPWLHGAYHLYLDRKDGKWTGVLPQRLLTQRAQRPYKANGLQGPIDDAFMDSFLCVRGTEKGWHEATAAYAEKNLDRFRREWAKYFRGQLAIKDDLDVTTEDIAGRHLILFGDPASNSLIAQVLDGLPLKWSAEKIVLGGKTYASDKNVPVMIYPNPLNAGRYVVLNSGHTFHAKDFESTNAWLFPRLGDWAVLQLPGGGDILAATPADAGLFDDFWQWSGK